MTATTLDPVTALIVVGLQKGVVAMPLAHPVGPVIENAVTLAEAFRARGLPVVLVNVSGGAPGRADQTMRGSLPADFAELIPELRAAPGDERITKARWGAFTGTELQARLRALGVTQVVLVGIATSIGVESTARHAHELGFHVTLVADAMTDRIAEAHENSVTRIFPRIGEVATTAEVLALLDKRDV